MLALQRQAGNVAVSRMLGTRMPGAFPEDVEEERAPSPVPSLDSQPETMVSAEEVPRPPTPASAASTEYLDAPGSSRPPTPSSVASTEYFDAPGNSRPPTPSSAASTEYFDAPEEQRKPWHILPKTPGDKAKSAGAAVGLTFPVLNAALIRSTAPNLSSGATGMAAASSTGDAVSEIIRLLQGRGFNIGKFLGGVATTGGLFTNSIAQIKGPAGDAARLGGLYTQTAGLIAKGIGESSKLEEGFLKFPDGDWSKAAGAFIAAAAPTLQAYAIKHQRRYEQMIAAGTHQGKIPVSDFAIAAAILSGASPAGDFASELVKAVRDRKVNVPKMLGGLFGAFGAVALTVGVATDNNAAKYAGYGLQAGGLGFKGWGEYSDHEERWPKLPQKERPAELEMQPPGART